MMARVSEHGEIEGLKAKYKVVDGLNTRYYELGEDKPEAMILCHGGEWSGGFSANTFSRNLHGLAQHFHVFAYDRPGAGMTDNPKTDADYTMAAQQRHLLAFIRTMGLARCHVGGQSRGAYAPTRIALEHPELVKSLIIVGTGTLAPDLGDLQERRRAIFSAAPEEPRARALSILSGFTYDPSHFNEEFMDAFLFMETRPKSLETIAAWKRNEKSFRDQLAVHKAETLQWIKEGRLKAPTILFWGREDRTALLPQGLQLFDAIAEHNDRTRMIIFNRARHYVYRDHPEEWNRYVIDFCTQLPTSAAQ